MNCTIRTGTIAEAVEISRQIPEFVNPHTEEEYIRRIQDTKHLILIACMENKPVGFKVGYDKSSDGSLYSWMGGVLPDFRKQQIAKRLAEVQERWAQENRYTAITFKTRNKHTAMLLFSIKNGFQIIEVEPRETIEEYRIVLKKTVKPKL